MSSSSEIQSSTRQAEDWRNKRSWWFVNGSSSQTNNVVTFINQISWVFAPLKPLYDSVKFSCPMALSSFLWIENFASQVVEFLSKRHAEREIIEEIKEVSDQRNSAEDSTYSYINSIIKQVYKMWFQSHQNLLVCVNYIANLYEEIIPLTPGDEAWNNLEKDNLSIRELCLYANINLARRLYYHSKKLLQQSVADNAVAS